RIPVPAAATSTPASRLAAAVQALKTQVTQSREMLSDGLLGAISRTSPALAEALRRLPMPGRARQMVERPEKAAIEVAKAAATVAIVRVAPVLTPVVGS